MKEDWFILVLKVRLLGSVGNCLMHDYVQADEDVGVGLSRRIDFYRRRLVDDIENDVIKVGYGRKLVDKATVVVHMKRKVRLIPAKNYASYRELMRDLKLLDGDILLATILGISRNEGTKENKDN